MGGAQGGGKYEQTDQLIYWQTPGLEYSLRDFFTNKKIKYSMGFVRLEKMILKQKGKNIRTY